MKSTSSGAGYAQPVHPGHAIAAGVRRFATGAIAASSAGQAHRPGVQRSYKWETPAPFRLGPYSVYPDSNTIVGPATTARLEPKIMAVLVALARTPREVVTREYLLDTIWANTVVTDEVVTRCISEIRQVFADRSGVPGFIQTIPKVGYRLVVTPAPLHSSSLRLTLLATLVALVSMATVYAAEQLLPYADTPYADTPHPDTPHPDPTRTHGARCNTTSRLIDQCEDRRHHYRQPRSSTSVNPHDRESTSCSPEVSTLMPTAWSFRLTASLEQAPTGGSITWGASP